MDKKEQINPVRIFNEEPKILCDNCKKNLLQDGNGIIVFLEGFSNWEKQENNIKANYITKIAYFSCKGECDKILKSSYGEGLTDRWKDIDDLIIPTYYIQNIIDFINDIKDNKMSLEAIEKIKQLYINIFPYIIRDMTEQEKERLSVINLISAV